MHVTHRSQIKRSENGNNITLTFDIATARHAVQIDGQVIGGKGLGAAAACASSFSIVIGPATCREGQRTGSVWCIRKVGEINFVGSIVGDGLGR